MRQILSLLALPVSIVLFLPRNPSLVSAAAASAEQWPYNLPEHAKYWPEDGPLRKRELEASQGPLLQAPRMPAGVRKMGGDEGEKFYMEFWEFDGQQESQSPSLEGPAIIEGRHASLGKLRSRSSEEDELTEYANATMTFPYKPALLRHTAEQTSLNPHFKRGFSYYSSLFARSPRAALAALQKRAFECPSGTNDCAEIGRSGSCCSQGEKCQIVPDTGTGGDVGCCPEGKSCSGNLGECDIGFTKCSDNLGGGCCIPMYICIDLGCEYPFHDFPHRNNNADP
ncbi:MAG: hypothetical protein M1837_001083 [Sclerophora amabilis]|nr:MAG: hypothetical protein M1837_001083 [Sclerophora amabilis]